MFCRDGVLIGTVSQVRRTGEDIQKYFEYFARKPGLSVLDKKYSISRVDDNVTVNDAFITWTWNGLEDPLVARMTFVFKGKCIFELHSSALPGLNDDLLRISGKP